MTYEQEVPNDLAQKLAYYVEKFEREDRATRR